MSGTTLTTAADMRAITGRLTAAGLETRLEAECCVRYIVATTPAGSEHGRAGSIEVVVDDDGYVELRWWIQPPATPAEVTDAILRAVTALTGGAR